MLPTKFLISSAAAYIPHYYYCKKFEHLLLLLVLSAIRNFPADLSLYGNRLQRYLQKSSWVGLIFNPNLYLNAQSLMLEDYH
jgi:hypothetical protein